MTVSIKAADSFQHEKFSWQTLVRFKKSCPAADGRCNSGRADLYIGAVSRDLHEERAAVEINLASAFVETENRVSAQTRDRKIGKGQLSA